MPKFNVGDILISIDKGFGWRAVGRVEVLEVDSSEEQDVYVLKLTDRDTEHVGIETYSIHYIDQICIKANKVTEVLYGKLV